MWLREIFMNKHAIIIHHSADWDGYGSRFVVELYLKKSGYKSVNIHSVGWNYGSKLEKITALAALHPHADIYMVDITLPDEFMNVYKNRIIWLDHHVSAISHAAAVMPDMLQRTVHAVSYVDSLPPYPEKPGGKQYQISSIELTWTTLFPDTELPEIIQCIGRSDVFDKVTLQNIPFYVSSYLKRVGFKNYYTILNSVLPLELRDTTCKEIAYDHNSQPLTLENLIIYGERYFQDNSEYLAKISVKTVKHALINSKWKALVANCQERCSGIFDSVARRNSEHIGIVYSYNYIDHVWDISIYQLAERKIKYPPLYILYQLSQLDGGSGNVVSWGGHERACGAQVKNINDFLLKYLTVS